MKRPESGTRGAVREPAARPGDGPAYSTRPLPSIIGSTVVMKGELVVGEDLVIEGTFDGTIVSHGRETVTLRRTARLSGKISASTVRIDEGIDLKDTVLSGRIGRTEQ